MRVTAANDYSTEILQSWAPLLVTDKAVAEFNANPDNELRLVADGNGEIVGFAAIVPDKEELRARYLAPNTGGRGVGKRLIVELERAARDRV